jgi:outer membrane receptor protein involved in Fe transport
MNERPQYDPASDTNFLSEKSDQFFLVDVGLGYRLPKRYGIFRLGIANLFDRKFDYLGLYPIRTSDIKTPPF